MRAAAFAVILLAASCERGPQSEANLPAAPGTTPAVSTGDLPQGTPPGSVTPCTVLPPEEAVRVKANLASVGAAGGWTIHAGPALVCSEPGPEGAVGCELAPGGTAIASQGDKTYGFRNDTAAPLSISVNTEGMSCGPLKTPPSPS
jgi:hypothetical protein